MWLIPHVVHAVTQLSIIYVINLHQILPVANNYNRASVDWFLGSCLRSSDIPNTAFLLQCLLHSIAPASVQGWRGIWNTTVGKSDKTIFYFYLRISSCFSGNRQHMMCISIETTVHANFSFRSRTLRHNGHKFKEVLALCKLQLRALKHISLLQCCRTNFGLPAASSSGFILSSSFTKLST